MSHSHPKRGQPRPPTDSTFPVPFLIVVAIVVVCAAVLFGWASHKPSRQELAQQISLGASADSQLMVTGTLAPLGSFEYVTSPLVTRLAVVERHAADALLRHQISRDQALEVQAEGDSAYAVIAQATRVCDPAPRSGTCRGAKHHVDELLEQARRLVGLVPDYTPGVQFSSSR